MDWENIIRVIIETLTIPLIGAVAFAIIKCFRTIGFVKEILYMFIELTLEEKYTYAKEKQNGKINFHDLTQCSYLYELGKKLKFNGYLTYLIGKIESLECDDKNNLLIQERYK